ncbi:hypothetical protein [Parahaliea mediterranea]|uniref:hypothetical protein n=1 Tax=Parahaliea mediterranea TaxID=651086 RepID=UPI000E2E9E4F|nr:hypothetical protein [Parahaliea mediterranea]
MSPREWLAELTAELAADSAVHTLSLCIVDAAVAPASSYRMNTLLPEAMDGALVVWLDAADHLREYDSRFRRYFRRFHGYVVCESDRLPQSRAQRKVGERMPGMNEIVLLQRPDRLSFEAWFSLWQDSHTQVAIDTQSTYGYRQNLVVRALHNDAPVVSAIIEENFPEKALHGRMAFYDADDDERLYRQREDAMMESCARFIDFDRIDCIPTSEYVLK